MMSRRILRSEEVSERKRKRKARVAACIGGLALCAAPALAHDHWFDGSRVDPVLKLQCCGDDDTKMVDELVRLSVDGHGVYFIDQPGALISFSRVQPSPDGHWWRSIADDDETLTIRCVFGPYSF
jgi:hypothetical protein